MFYEVILMKLNVIEVIIMKRKFHQWLSTIPKKLTIAFHL